MSGKMQNAMIDDGVRCNDLTVIYWACEMHV